MNHKEWKNQAIFGRLMESFGYKTLNEGEMVDEVVEKEEELDEAHCGRREDDEEVMEEELEEGAKPDFLDLDKDGDKEEPMKKAAEDAKEDKVDEETIREAVRKAIKKAIL